MSQKSYKNPSYETSADEMSPPSYPTAVHPPVVVSDSHTQTNNNQSVSMASPPSIRVYISPTTIRVNVDYPLHFVVFHCVFLAVISLTQICIDLFLMSKDNSFIFSIGGTVDKIYKFRI